MTAENRAVFLCCRRGIREVVVSCQSGLVAGKGGGNGAVGIGILPANASPVATGRSSLQEDSGLETDPTIVVRNKSTDLTERGHQMRYARCYVLCEV